MTDAVAEAEEDPPKKGKASLLIGLVLALVGAGGGFFAVQSGLLPFGGNSVGAEEQKHAEQEEYVSPHEDIAFVQVPTMVISFTDGGRRQVLRFTIELEVSKAAKEDVELLTPRIVDVLNTYLRALELSDIDDPLALTKLRAQMLRRVQIVTGRKMIRDLLVMEFVLT